MKVLHLASVMGVGGAETLAAELMRDGAAVGWDSAVASGGGVRADELRAEGFPTYPVPPARRSAAGLLRARSAARRAVRAAAPDVILAHNVSATAVARSARPGVPVVTVFHGVGAQDYRAAARVLRLTSDHVVAVSEAIADRLRAAGLRGVGLSVIRNAVRAPAPVDRAAARAFLGLDDAVPVALCLARLERQKRHDVLLDAFSRLEGGVLLLAGDGALRDEIERAAAPLGARVRVLGARTDVPALLAAADVTVLTSDWEGLPMAVLESMAAGTPVVATDVDGLREVLGHGGGVLVPPRDPAAVAAALTTLLGDPAARAAAGRDAAAVIDEHYRTEVMTAAYDDLLRRVLDRGSR